MKVTFHIAFTDGGVHQGYARLEREIPFAPTPGFVFEQLVWKEPKAASKVSYNIDENSFYVVFPAEVVSASNADRNKEVYEIHGWSVS